MHAEHETPQPSTPHKLTHISPIKAALADLGSLKLEKSPCYTEIAAKHGVERFALSQRHCAITTSRATAVCSKRKLNTQQERELIQYREVLSRRVLPPKKPMIRNFATAIARTYIGKCWVGRFVNRYSIHLIS